MSFIKSMTIGQLLSCLTALLSFSSSIQLTAAPTGVTVQRPAAFLLATPTVGPITASPTSIPAGVSTPVAATVQIASTSVITNGVNLLQVDAAGANPTILGVMTDAGNGSFQLTVSLAPPQGSTQVYLQASAAFKGVLQRVKSSILPIAVTTSTGSPTVTITPGSLTFPVQNLNTTSAPQTFTIANSGNQPVSIASITTSGDFAISNNPCPASLAVSTSCTVSVTFTPTAVGTRTSSVVITDNATGSPQSVALTGTGQNAPTTTITLNPTSLTFAAQNLNTTSAPQTFTIGNSGNQPVSITSITTSGDFAISNNPCPASLAVSTSCTVSVTFTPTAVGTRTSSVVITDNATGSPQSVALTGTGQNGPITTITLNPTSLSFAAQSLNSTSAPQTFTIANSGNQPVTITSITTSGDFAISSNPCPASLAVSTSCTVSVTFTPTATGTRTSSVVISDNASGSPQSVALTGTGQTTGTPTITGFSPASGPIGTIVTVSLSNFTPASGVTPQVTLSSLSSGSIVAPINAFSPTSISFVVPAGAATGNIAVTFGTQNANSSSPFSVSTSSGFTLNVGPSTASLIQGQSVTYAVTVNSTNGFDGLATLSVGGLPSGVQASFKPAAASAGQTAILTLSAPANQAKSTSTLSISASATIDGQSVSQSATATLKVTGVTTTFLGRTVVDDSQETPIAGVTVKFLGVDSQGNITGCSGQTTSDAGGNFSLTNLPTSCVGPQLISYNGLTATAPSGTYAGVNLSYTLTAAQVTTSPVLIHLPRIDNAETVSVQQNSATNQVFAFHTIPGLVVTVYAGTTFSLDDGSQPNPFPIIAIQVPVDRLPDQMATSGMVMPFIVAFQPANAVASQPVAVNFPNSVNAPPGSSTTFMTLDPTRGFMVPYGTGTVSSDGAVITADSDPSHPGHGYGLVHFDWHGPALAPQPNGGNPGPNGCKLQGACDPSPKNNPGPTGKPPCNPKAPPGSSCSTGQNPSTGDPIDLASGLHTISANDISISGPRGSISIQRTYRGLTTNPGPFGLGGQLQYSWLLNTNSPSTASAINLVSPDGNQYLFSLQTNGTFTNSTVPWLQGAVMTTNAANQTTLRLYDGTVLTFQVFRAVSALVSIADSNNNTVQLTESLDIAAQPRITQITDPVGRSLNLSYNAQGFVASVTDPIGRKVSYTYNPSGTLATITNAANGVTTYNYDAQNRLISMVDPRGITVFQDTFDANSRVVSQTLADGSVINIAYITANPALATSPIAQATVTDALGNQTSYRFNVQGFVMNVIDALGQTKTFTRDPATNNVLQVAGPAQCSVCGPPGQGTVSYTYDSQGNRLTSTDALGNMTTYTYEPVFNQVTSITDPLNHTTSYAYDSHGNLVKIIDENGNVTRYSYDSTGLLVQTADALGNQTTISYDAFGNPSAVTDAAGNITKSLSDSASRPISITDPSGRTSTLNFDALNRITSVRDGRGSTTQFSYDPNGNLLSLADPKNNQSTFTYDQLNRVSARTSPLGKTETYQYDLNGNLTQFTDRGGQVSTYNYDSLNRLSKEIYQDGAVVSSSYDPYSRLINVNDSVGGLFTFTYDANGSLLSQDGPTGSIAYTRDALRRVLTEEVAGQSTVSYAYDPVGNLLNAAMPAAGITYSYDPRNMPIAATRTNNVVSTYAYDNLGRLTSLIHSLGASAINTQAYSYDPSGGRQSATNSISQALVTQASAATVDQANELLNNGSTTYTYDLNGNRLTETASGKTTSYQWDARNRLSSITDPSGSVTSFKYDFRRNLIELDRVVSGATTPEKFVIDSLANVVSLTASSGLPLSVLAGRSIDSHIASVDSLGNVAFGISDALGSNLGVTNGQGVLASTLVFEPYGQTTGSPSAAYPFAFSGRLPITTSIYYYRQRFYDTSSGRFIAEDTSGFRGGESNLYRYAGNNPTNLVDPRGSSWTGVVVGGVLYLGGLALEYTAAAAVGGAGVAYSIWDQLNDEAASKSEADYERAMNIPPPPDDLNTVPDFPTIPEPPPGPPCYQCPPPPLPLPPMSPCMKAAEQKVCIRGCSN